MTGHVIIQTQNQTPSFLTTLQATLDILDDISGRIDENTYLTLANNLQQLHNIHTSNPTSNSTSNQTSYANRPITTPINNIRNDYISYRHASLSNFDISNTIINDIINNTNNNINNTNNNNINNNEYRNIQSLNEETARMNYSTRTRLILYGNAFNNGAN